MFFSQLTERIRGLTTKRSTNKSAAAGQITPTNKKISKQLLLKAKGDINSKNKLNKALADIERSIKNDGPTSQRLLEKARILLQKAKFHQARQILQTISKDKNDSKSSNAAKRLLSQSKQLQEEFNINKTNKLIRDLHETAKNYGQKLSAFPKSDVPPSDLDIPQLVREEARRARSAQLPGLSYQLIQQTLQAGHDSPWLHMGKALSLNMMGQKASALSILNEIKKSAKGNKISTSINNTITDIKRQPKVDPSKSNLFLLQQSRAIAKSHGLETQFIPETNNISPKINVKSSIFNEAISSLANSPRASLGLVNSILDYFPSDGASLQLKADALAALNRGDEAIQIWTNLARSKNNQIADKASKSTSQYFGKKAKKISTHQSLKAPALFFVQQHLDQQLTPVLSDEAKEILKQIEPERIDETDAELEQHQLQLLLNTLIVDYLETQQR